MRVEVMFVQEERLVRRGEIKESFLGLLCFDGWNWVSISLFWGFFRFVLLIIVLEVLDWFLESVLTVFSFGVELQLFKSVLGY